ALADEGAAQDTEAFAVAVCVRADRKQMCVGLHHLYIAHLFRTEGGHPHLEYLIGVGQPLHLVNLLITRSEVEIQPRIERAVLVGEIERMRIPDDHSFDRQLVVDTVGEFELHAGLTGAVVAHPVHAEPSITRTKTDTADSRHRPRRANDSVAARI